MTEFHIPTEQELDALLDEEPQFDLDAVKRRALSRIGEPAEQPRKRRLPLRQLSPYRGAHAHLNKNVLFPSTETGHFFACRSAKESVAVKAAFRCVRRAAGKEW